MNIARYLLMRAKSMRGMTVVHVGAHFGQEARRYQNMLADQVVWVEACPEIFKVLQANIASTQGYRSFLSKVLSVNPTKHVCINALISESDEQQADFHVFSNDGASNSMFQLDRENDVFSAVRETGEVLKLQTKTLDQTLAEAGVDPSTVDVLVLDVQGAELMCLKGAETVLRHARYIESEVSTESVYKGGVLLNELEAWLNERGFVRSTAVRRIHTNAIFRKVHRS